LARKNIGGKYIESEDTVTGGKWGFVDTSGREIIPIVYDNVSIFKDGFAKASLNGKYGLLNKKGNEVIPLIYDNIEYTSEGMTGVFMNDKWGFIDSKGEKIIPFRYKNVTSFENGMAGVCKNGKWGLIDKKGRVLVSYMYNNISQLENYRKTGIRHLEKKPEMNNILYNNAIGIYKAWAALFVEAAFLFMINMLLPAEKTDVFWMLIGITIIVSFLLFYVIINTIQKSLKRRIESRRR